MLERGAMIRSKWKRQTLLMMVIVGMMNAEKAPIHESAISRNRRGTIATTNGEGDQDSDLQSSPRLHRRKRPLAYEHANNDQENSRQSVDEIDHDNSDQIGLAIHDTFSTSGNSSSPSSPFDWGYVWNTTQSTSSALHPKSAMHQIQHGSTSQRNFVSRNRGRYSLQHPRRSATATNLPVLFLLPWLQFVRQVIRAVADDWNFKGFGWAFYKSVLIREACGVALRIPLSLNFASWDRHSTSLPYFSGSVGVYYPWMTSFTLSLSMNAQVLRNILGMVIAQLRDGLLFILVTIIRTVTICASSLLYPLTRLYILPQWKFQHRRAVSPNEETAPTSATTTTTSTSRTSEQRIGLAWSWRYSLSQGFEFRISYTHMFLQTILYVLESLLAPRLAPILKAWLDPTFSQVVTPSFFGALCDRLRRRTAAFGISSAVIHDLSKCSCNVMLSLSGFRLIRSRKQHASLSANAQTAAEVSSEHSRPSSLITSEDWSSDDGIDDSMNEEEELEFLSTKETSTNMASTEESELRGMSLAADAELKPRAPHAKARTTLTSGFKVTG